MRGHCLCTQIQFEVAGTDFKLYQCHCSLCRRQSGSSANAATIAAERNFRWLQGQELISSWVKPSGFRADFCSVCGSPVPNPLRGLPWVWVPTGLLDCFRSGSLAPAVPVRTTPARSGAPDENAGIHRAARTIPARPARRLSGLHSRHSGEQGSQAADGKNRAARHHAQLGDGAQAACVGGAVHG